jgi:hypothetical protein
MNAAVQVSLFSPAGEIALSRIYDPASKDVPTLKIIREARRPAKEILLLRRSILIILRLVTVSEGCPSNVSLVEHLVGHSSSKISLTASIGAKQLPESAKRRDEALASQKQSCSNTSG